MKQRTDSVKSSAVRTLWKKAPSPTSTNLACGLEEKTDMKAISNKYARKVKMFY